MQLNDYEVKHNTYLRENGAGCTLFLKRGEGFPLSSASYVALYGSGARRTIKGGTGSGEVNSRFFVNIEEGLEEAGFTVTTKAWLDEYDEIRAEAHKQFIKQIKADARKHHVLALIEGMGKVMPEPAYVLPLDGIGDTAVYVLGRISGEGADRTPAEGDIKMTPTEIRDILVANEKYEKFMLVINAGGPVDLSPVENKIENILVLSQLGVETGHILADILLGKVNPSGKLTTTWTNWEDYPTVGGFGDKNDTYYREGIYVGYRYFDTVGKLPVYPFGFGLSYTDFSYSTDTVSKDGDLITIKATVSNIGKFAGREVLQAYMSAPQGKLDKPYQELCAFAKSPMLQPSESAEVSMSFSMRDLASYDTAGSRFVLEAGEYVLRLGNSSIHTEPVCVLILDKEVTTLRTKNCFAGCEFDDFVPDSFTRQDTLDKVTRIELDASAFETVTVEYDQHIEIAPEVEALTDEQLVSFNIGEYSKGGGVASIIGEASSHVAGAAGETTNILEKDGCPALIMSDGPAGLRLSREYTRDADGKAHTVGTGVPDFAADFLPAPLLWLINHMPGQKKTEKDAGEVILEQYATAIPIGTAIAQSFDIDFAYRCGDIVGDEMERFGVDLWLAPALNIHRSICCGRNFEYFSEDPIVSGKFAAAITNGVQKHPGRGTTVKHYAANNQETNRYNNNSHVSERAMREIYLKGFGICVRESQPFALMTSYNLLNGTHTSESRELVDDVLRSEFGYEGVVMTDWVVNGGTLDKSSVHPAPVAYKVAACGNDLFMPGSKKEYDNVYKALKKGDVSKQQLQENATRVYKLASQKMTS